MVLSNAFADYADFETKFREHFVATASDLIAVPVTWSNLAQRASDTVESYYTQFTRVRSQRHSLGHVVPEQEAILRFQQGVHDYNVQSLHPCEATREPHG